MSELNNDIISDESLRNLLRLCILEGDDNDTLTQQLMDMETTFAIGGDAFVMPAIPGEKLLLDKLKLNLGKGAHLKWIFGGIIAVAAGSGFYLSSGNEPAKETSFSVPAPALIPDTVFSDSIKPAEITPEKQVVQWPVSSDPSAVKAFDPVLFNDPNPDFTPQYPIPILKPDSPVIENDNSYCKSVKTIPVQIGSFSLDTLFDNISKIELDASFGNIDISAGSSDKTSLNALIEINGKFRKNKGHYDFIYEKKGELLRISFRPGSNINLVGRQIQQTGSFRIITPSRTEVSVKNNSGNISIKGLHSKFNTADCAYGNITIENMVSDVNLIARSGQVSVNTVTGTLNVQNHYGNILVKDIKGPVNLTSYSGQISAQSIEGICKIEARYGNILIKDINGETDLTSSSGSILGKHIKAQHLNVVSRYGPVDLKSIEAGLDIESSSGSVSISELNGDAKINCTYGKQTLSDITGKVVTYSRSGDISISRLKGDLELESVYGNVDINELQGKVKIVMTSGNVFGIKINLKETLDIYSKYGNVRIQLENDNDQLSYDLSAPTGKLKISKGNLNQSTENGKISIKRGTIQVRSYTASGSQEFF